MLRSLRALDLPLCCFLAGMQNVVVFRAVVLTSVAETDILLLRAPLRCARAYGARKNLLN